MADIIQIRRDTASNWTSTNPTLASGELALETDTGKLKAGDGSTAWTSLSYYTLGTSGFAPLASPTFTGTVTGPTINASTSLQIGGAAVTSTPAELNLLDNVSGLVQADFTKLAAVDASATELNYSDGVTSAIQTQLDAKLGTTLTGELAGADNTVSRVNLKDYGEVTNAIGGTGGGTQDIDLTAGNCVSATVDTSANTFTFSNPTASDELCGFVLFLTNGGSQTVTWPGTVDWPAATAPTLSASGVDILVFQTINGGTTWHGQVSATLSS